ncbi:zinc-ribbon domain-containing protein [Methanobrevibacter sp.]
MDIYCENCGEKNNAESKFCKNCGTQLKSPQVSPQKSTDKNKVIILALIGVIAVLAIGVLFAGGVFKGEVPLETRDFEVFEMDVPKGSDFVEQTSMPAYPGIGGFIFLENVGDYSDEVYTLDISTLQYKSIIDEFKYERTEGDIKIYKDRTGTTDLYYLVREVDEFDFSLMGEDVDTMVKMLNSIKITDKTKLTSESSQTTSTQSTTSAAPTSATPSSISILGGSFSTGSADADKTYARINVGTSHAGEEVIVQIFYSRDGNSLNNGNMVPATVHSDGYLEIASADAYKYYPDHATVKIYDKNSKLLTTKEVYLSPTSGTQTF